MRLPRIVFGVGYLRWWQELRRENLRLKREVGAWQDKFLQRVGTTSLHAPPPAPTVSVATPPVGLAAKRAQLAQNRNPNDPPSAEQILAAAEKARNGNH